MNDRLEIKPHACDSCPYSRSTPLGIWHEEEYEKLCGYDRETWDQQGSGLFLCHQRDGTLCSGWVKVSAHHSLAFRFALIGGRVADMASSTTAAARLRSGG